MAQYSSYNTALKKGGKDVWPGCGRSGRCRPCGNVHHFQKYFGNSLHHDYACLYNHERGCPMQIPDAEHDLNRVGRCRVCGVYPRSTMPAASGAGG